MFFKRKGYIRQQEDNQLYSLIDRLKKKLTKQQQLVSKSVDPSESVLFDLKLTEAKYLFLLREARNRHKKSE